MLYAIKIRGSDVFTHETEPTLAGRLFEVARGQKLLELAVRVDTNAATCLLCGARVKGQPETTLAEMRAHSCRDRRRRCR